MEWLNVRGELKYSKFSFGVEVDFTRIGDFTWRVSDCEELVGVNHRRWCCGIGPEHIRKISQLKNNYKMK